MISVPPPDLRPLILLDSGNFATADINDLYRQIINQNNRLAKLKELKAPSAILHNQTSMLQSAVDCLHANVLVPNSRQEMGENGRPLVCLLNMLIGKISANGHPVEWAGQARAVVDPEIELRRVNVPARIFDELHLRNNEPVLLTSSENKFVARLPNRIDGPLIRVHNVDAAGLLGQESIVSIHRPLTAGALHEANNLLAVEGEWPPVDRISSDDWCDDSPLQFLASLIYSASNGETVKMNSTRGLAIFGTRVRPRHTISTKSLTSRPIGLTLRKDFSATPVH